MNLQELLDEIRNHPKTILVEELLAEDYGFYLFVRVTYVKDATNNIADQMSVCIIVQDRDEGTEQAFYKGSQPSYMDGSTLREEIETFLINYQISNPELEFWRIINVDAKKEVAEIVGFVLDVGDLIEVKYLAFKLNSALTFRKIKEA